MPARRGRIGIRDAVKNVSNVTFNFSNTERGENVQIDALDGDIVLDVSGALWAFQEPSGSLTVTVIGGLDTHAYRKDKTPSVAFYIHPEQISTIKKMMREFAILNRYEGQVNPGNNEDLFTIAYGAFQNGRL